MDFSFAICVLAEILLTLLQPHWHMQSRSNTNKYLHTITKLTNAYAHSSQYDNFTPQSLAFSTLTRSIFLWAGDFLDVFHDNLNISQPLGMICCALSAHMKRRFYKNNFALETRTDKQLMRMQHVRQISYLSWQLVCASKNLQNMRAELLLSMYLWLDWLLWQQRANPILLHLIFFGETVGSLAIHYFNKLWQDPLPRR